MSAAQMRAGIDLGGTKIEIAVLDRKNRIILRERTATPQGDYPATVRAISNLVFLAEERLGTLQRIGIGVPGTISPATGLMKNANSVWLNGNPLDRDLEDALDRQIRIANDANCFALSEAVDGAGQDASTVFGVILGTGVGGGIVVNKQVISGAHAIAGEWGHNPLPRPASDPSGGKLCFCGRTGCIETYLSGAGLAADYESQTGEKITAFDIADRASICESAALASLDRYFDRLASALGTIVNVLDPDIIVLGGGLSHIDALYTEIPQRLSRYVFSDICTTPIVKNMHGDSSGVRGAAWLWG
jgi:fructokinase